METPMKPKNEDPLVKSSAEGVVIVGMILYYENDIGDRFR